MNAQELAALIKQAQTGDTDGFAQLYKAVYRPIYKIARMAMKSEDAAVEAVRLTVLDIRQALDELPDIERLVLSVSTVCGCSAEKTAKLCGYTEETVGVCLTNAEVTMKTRLLSGQSI